MNDNKCILDKMDVIHILTYNRQTLRHKNAILKCHIETTAVSYTNILFII